MSKTIKVSFYTAKNDDGGNIRITPSMVILDVEDFLNIIHIMATKAKNKEDFPHLEDIYNLYFEPKLYKIVKDETAFVETEEDENSETQLFTDKNSPEDLF